jgi:polysaccharide biosynthesis protein PslG
VRLRPPLIVCLALLAALLAGAPATAKKHHRHHRDWCPKALKHCPLKLTRPHGLIPGLNEDWQVRRDDLGYASKTRALTIRFPLTWATVQPRNEDVWDWSVYDQLFAAARARGLSVILTPTDAPCWAHPLVACSQSGSEPPDRAFDPAWEEFIRKVVRRYPDLTALEVWNEPNFSPFWGQTPDPERYTELLKGAYRASKSARPDVPVLFGGLSPITGSSPGQMDDLEFLRRAYNSGAAGYFNAIGLHPYPMPFNRRDYRQRALRLIAGVRRLAYRHQHAQMPIWVTEIGISTDGAGSVSAPQQARRLNALYHLLARVPDLPVVIVHRVFDQPGRGSTDNGWGLVRSDLELKPAYGTIKAAFSYFNRLPGTPPGSWTPPGERPPGSGSGLLPVPLPWLGG